MSNLCIIPARGGSKRIPRKNIREFLGKPIIAYSIESALKSELFDEVMVSTDDAEIAEIAMSYGAKVPFMRSSKSANDVATTYDVIEEVINDYKLKGRLFENACCIYPCAPLILVDNIKESFRILENFDSVLPIVEFSFPIQRAFKKEDSSKISFINPEFELSRSQDMAKSFHDAGQFYWFKVDKVLQNKSVMSNNTGCIVLSEMEVQDIDNEVDWQLAELKYKLNNEVS